MPLIGAAETFSMVHYCQCGCLEIRAFALWNHQFCSLSEGSFASGRNWIVLLYQWRFTVRETAPELTEFPSGGRVRLRRTAAKMSAVKLFPSFLYSFFFFSFLIGLTFYGTDPVLALSPASSLFTLTPPVGRSRLVLMAFDGLMTNYCVLSFSSKVVCRKSPKW